MFGRRFVCFGAVDVDFCLEFCVFVCVLGAGGARGVL